MKNIKYTIHFLILGIIIGFASCDYIDEPYTTGDIAIITKDTVRKILLEDFTGHRCINCPQAHEVIHDDIIKRYGDRAIVIATHANFFAKPLPGKFSYDFRTIMGEELFDYFGLSDLPIGMVNRTPQVGVTAIPMVYTLWLAESSRYLEHMSEEPDAYIHLDVTYNASDSTVNVATETSVYNSNSVSHKYNLVVVITEDKIIKPQVTPDGDVSNYQHDHVLRGSLNGTWGDEIIVNGSTVPLDINNNYKLGSDWNPDNCNVVAYLYHSDGVEKNQILQAQKVSLK